MPGWQGKTVRVREPRKPRKPGEKKKALVPQERKKKEHYEHQATPRGLAGEKKKARKGRRIYFQCHDTNLLQNRCLHCTELSPFSLFSQKLTTLVGPPGLRAPNRTQSSGDPVVWQERMQLKICKTQILLAKLNQSPFRLSRSSAPSRS